MARNDIFRIVAAVMALALSIFLILAGFAGGLHRDDSTDRTITFLLAAAIGGAVALAVRRTDRSAAYVLGLCAIVGVGWDLAIDAPLASTAGFWAALAIAGGLCWRVAQER